MTDIDLARADVVRNLSNALFRLMIETSNAHGDGELEITMLDCVIACGTAVKAIAVMVSQMPGETIMSEADALHDLEAAFARGLTVPRELVAPRFRSTPRH